MKPTLVAGYDLLRATIPSCFAACRMLIYGPVRREYDQSECRNRARQQNQVRDAAMDFFARLDQGAARLHASLKAISYLTFDT